MPLPLPAAPVAKRRPGCLARLLGLVALGLLAGAGAWLWDAVVEAPWAHVLPWLGKTGDRRPATLTGEWLGDVVSPSGRIHGVLWLRIERRHWGSAGRTRGVGGASHPDFAGTARLCGLSNASGPRELWGWASGDASRVHAVLPFAPGAVWNVGALDGAWSPEAGTLTLTGRLDSNGGRAPGGPAADETTPTTITLRSGSERDFEARCAPR
jgi:hypothetical protein